MGNTLNNLMPTIYKAVDVVSREIVGFIPACMLDSSAEQVAVGQSIVYPVVGAYSASDITPSATGPNPSASTITSDSMSITKSRSVTFFWEGEEIKATQSGNIYSQTLQNQFAQAMRTLVNEIETDISNTYKSASRAYGTAGTTPFGSNLDELAQIRKILVDNGAPLSDLQLVIDTTAGAKLRTLAQLTKANEAGSTDTLRRGVLLDVFGMAIRESAWIRSHTKGTGTDYLTNGIHTAGTTTINVDTGTGTIVAGDVVTFGSDPNKYVVVEALSAGAFKIAKPGLLKDVADNTAVTISNSYTANMAFSKNAIHLLARVPAMPPDGDSADDVTVITDPVSGLNFQIAIYRQYRRIAFEVGIAWGVKAAKQEHIALLLG
jgi:hypothetical protein